MLWYLRRGLEGAAGAQRRMVEKRIERVREKEKSVLYKVAGGAGRKGSISKSTNTTASTTPSTNSTYRGAGSGPGPAPEAAVLSEADTAQIEAQLSPEQLQLFAEENDSMLTHYEDTLGKVQYGTLCSGLLGYANGCVLEMPRNRYWRFRHCRKLW